MKTVRYIILCITSVAAINVFAQVSPTIPVQQTTPTTTNPTTVPTQPQPSNQLQPTTANPATGTTITDPSNPSNPTTNPINPTSPTTNPTMNATTPATIGTSSDQSTTQMLQSSYTQGDWNSSTVPDNLKTSFGNSQYNTQKVTGYWESNDGSQKSYYLQTTDSQGKVTGLWSDQNGTLSSTPPKH